MSNQERPLTPEEERELMMAIQQAQWAENQPPMPGPLEFGQPQDWGLPSNFYGLEDLPDAFDRADDRQDMIYDTLKLSQYQPFLDTVPGLPTPVEDPGDYVEYLDDDAGLYANNPAHEQVDALMSEQGLSLDEAVSAVVADPQFEGALTHRPAYANESAASQDAGGDPLSSVIDVEGFREDVRSRISGRDEADRINNENLRLQDEYDLYVNGTDDFTAAYGGQENFDRMVKSNFREIDPEMQAINQLVQRQGNGSGSRIPKLYPDGVPQPNQPEEEEVPLPSSALSVADTEQRVADTIYQAIGGGAPGVAYRDRVEQGRDGEPSSLRTSPGGGRGGGRSPRSSGSDRSGPSRGGGGRNRGDRGTTRQPYRDQQASGGGGTNRDVAARDSSYNRQYEKLMGQFADQLKSQQGPSQEQVYNQMARQAAEAARWGMISGV